MKNKDVIINQSELEWLVEAFHESIREFEELEEQTEWFTTKCIEKNYKAIALIRKYLHD